MIINLFISCNEKNNYPIVFDFEKTNKSHFISNNNLKIRMNNSWTKEYSKSGLYCAKIFKENPFGLSYSFENLKKGNQIIISVWEKSNDANSYLKLIGNKHDILFSKKSNRDIKNTDWQLISMKLTIQKDYDHIKFFVHNPSAFPSYYDDLNINVIENAKGRRVVLAKQNIDIQISEKDLKTLHSYRETALKNGIINKSLKKYFKSQIIYKGNKIPIKIRLKGDWTDHLKSDKWSFRIKVEGNYHFNGLKSFSIQHPKTRSFLKEWIIHKLFKKEQILTTRYNFVSVSLNGKKLGLYALEEHFRKELLDFYDYEDGPILKFDEEGLWETRLNNPKNKMAYPYFESSEIIPFNKKTISKSKKLTEIYQDGKVLMQKFKSLNYPLEDIFDLKKTALFFALNDLARVRHSYHWHNQRFYYNPEIKKLEFIAYDCYAGIYEGIEDVIYGFSNSNSKCSKTNYLSKQFFNNNEFIKYYKKYLNEISKESYVENIFKVFNPSVDSLLSIINYEFPIYDFDLNYLRQNAVEIRELLAKYDTNYSFSNIIPNYNYNGIKNNYFPSVGVKAKVKIINDSLFLRIDNFHLDTVYIIGYENNRNKIIDFDHPIEMTPFQKDGDKKKVLINEVSNYLIIKPQNIDSIFKVNIN